VVGERNAVAPGVEEPLSAWVREICHTAPDGELHWADIKTPTGIVIEVQHSAMTDAERLSREAFYGNLVGIIDGKPFKANFDIYHELPDPRSELAKDIIWTKARRHMNRSNRGLFFRMSEFRKEYPDVTKATVRGGGCDHDLPSRQHRARDRADALGLA
jgi:competence protein CoiA